MMADSSKNLSSKLLLPDNDLARKTTFADTTNLPRRSSYARAFTFDGAALQQTVAKPFEGLKRTITEVGNRFDPDAKFTKAVLNDYTRVAEEGNEGDLPLPSGFARKWKFWKITFWGALLAIFMGVAAAGFLNFADEIPKQWNSCDYKEDATCGLWYEGEHYWIFISGAGGFVVGLLRWTFDYPSNLPGIFKEIQTYHVEPRWIFITYMCSALSLASGATLGPEQALGNLGGGIATFLTHYIDFLTEDYKNIFVLSGMSGALGALFPAPMLGALMMHELGEPPGAFMESTIILSTSACIGFAVYYEMVDVTYLNHVTASTQLSQGWINFDGGYESWQICTGFIIGIVSACLCFMVLLHVGVCKQIFFRLREKLAFNSFLRETMPPMIGGLAIGTVNWALPGTFGNGNILFDWIIKYGVNETGGVTQRLLLCTGFARMFLLGISMNCGFVGGIIFPFLTMGIIAGSVMCINYPGIPVGLCLGTFMISVSCGIVPMPFTFTALSCFVYFFGLYQTVPIFVASFTAYALICGSGLLKKLGKAAEARAQAAKQGSSKSSSFAESESKDLDSTKASTISKKEADDFALKQYLGKKKEGTNPMHTSGH